MLDAAVVGVYIGLKSLLFPLSRTVASLAEFISNEGYMHCFSLTNTESGHCHNSVFLSVRWSWSTILNKSITLGDYNYKE